MNRAFFLVVASVSLLLAIGAGRSVFQSEQAWGRWAQSAKLEYTELHGFNGGSGAGPAQGLVSNYSEAIKQVSEALKAQTDRQFWVGLLLTFFAAISALVTGLYAAGSDGVLPRKATVAVAVLTCCTTVATYGNSHVEKGKDALGQERSQLVMWLNELVQQVNAAADADEAQKIIQSYEIKLATR